MDHVNTIVSDQSMGSKENMEFCTGKMCVATASCEVGDRKAAYRDLGYQSSRYLHALQKV